MAKGKHGRSDDEPVEGEFGDVKGEAYDPVERNKEIEGLKETDEERKEREEDEAATKHEEEKKRLEEERRLINERTAERQFKARAKAQEERLKDPVELLRTVGLQLHQEQHEGFMSQCQRGVCPMINKFLNEHDAKNQPKEEPEAA